MLKVNVGMSRKLSRDFNSTGFSVNLEGEIGVNLDDPEIVIERIREIYDLADEALAQQIERYEGESAIASRDEEPRHPAGDNPPPRSNGRYTGHGNRAGNGNGREYGNSRSRTGNGTGGGYRNGNGNGSRGQSHTPATNKQIQFLLNLGKRQGLTKPRLESRVAEIVGHDVDLYDLSKQEAGVVLDQLTSEVNDAAPQRGR